MISHWIYEREFFALLGPSGCGKTTLMRMLAGFETPTEGRILLDGQDVSTVPPYRRPVNMMFQSYALFPHMNVAENIAFGLKQDRTCRNPRSTGRVDEMLKLVKLEPFAKPQAAPDLRRPAPARGARPLARQGPKVLLLDEPLGALDKKLREETQFELMDLQETLGMTFVIVTHDQEEAMTVADRIAVMDHGKLVQVAPHRIYEYPEFALCRRLHRRHQPDRRHGRSAARQGHAVESRLPAPVVSGRTRWDPGRKAWIAIRPEKVRIGLDKPADAPAKNVSDGEVWDIGYLGGVSTYHVAHEIRAIVKAMRANADRIWSMRPINWEDQVWLHFAPDGAVVLLDMSGDGQRIKRQPLLGHRHPLSLAAGLLPRPVSDRLRISFSEVAIAIPPYRPIFDLARAGTGSRPNSQALAGKLRFLAADDLYIRAYLSSLQIAAISTLLTLLVGYPIAYGMARAPGLARHAADAGDPAVLDERS
jgi:putrescine transport system ATP-binding protein